MENFYKKRILDCLTKDVIKSFFNYSVLKFICLSKEFVPVLAIISIQLVRFYLVLNVLEKCEEIFFKKLVDFL